MNYRKRISTVIGLGVLAWNVSATEYSFAPRMRTTMRAEDNIRGDTINPKSAFGFDVGGAADFQAVSESVTSNLIPRANFRRFVIGDENDANEYGVALNNDLVRDRYQTGVDFSYSHDSTLTTEASESGGLVNTVTARDGINVGPNVAYLVSDRVIAQAGALYNAVSYAENPGADFVDYEYKQGNIGANYQWRDNALIMMNGYISQFSSGNGQSKTRSYRGMAGLTWRWSETLETTGSLGWNHSDIRFFNQQATLVPTPTPHVIIQNVDIHASAGGPIASAMIQKTFEYMIMRLDYSRQVSPTGRGLQSEADSIVLGVSRRLTDRLVCQLEGVYDMQTAEIADLQNNLAASTLDRDYTSASVNLRYQLGRDWLIDSTYRFSHRTNAGGGAANTSEGNSVFVSVEFNGQPIQF